MSRVLYALAGFVGGLPLSAMVASCCDETPVIHEVQPGTYGLDPVVSSLYMHDDTNYTMVVSEDGGTATETYERGGIVHQAVYAIGDGSDWPLTTDLSLQHDWNPNFLDAGD